jgi:hypothetical protein
MSGLFSLLAGLLKLLPWLAKLIERIKDRKNETQALERRDEKHGVIDSRIDDILRSPPPEQQPKIDGPPGLPGSGASGS